jgi:hypothetical protein
MAGPVEQGLERADSPNLRVVKGAFEVLGEGGLIASRRGRRPSRSAATTRWW